MTAEKPDHLQTFLKISLGMGILAGGLGFLLTNFVNEDSEPTVGGIEIEVTPTPVSFTLE